MRLRRTAYALTLSASLTATVEAPAFAGEAVVDHLGCAGTYAAIVLAIPYLPGIFLMPSIAPRSGYAQRIYSQTTPADEALSRDEILAEVERRKKALMDAFNGKEISLEDLTRRAHECDGHYGHEPVRTSLSDRSTPK